MKKILILSLSSVYVFCALASANTHAGETLFFRNQALCQVVFSDTTGNEYLRAFRKQYHLLEVVEGQEDDLQKALEMLHWTTSQWKHNGGHSAGTDDAFEILQRVAAGEEFSCAEFAVVFVTAVNAIGIPARVVNLKIRESQTASSGAGHSLAEVYISDQQKWVMMDPQSDLVAYAGQIPLSALELRRAIDASPEKIRVLFRGEWGNENLISQVINWYDPYLYFFDIAFDNRLGMAQKKACNGNDRLFLVPEGDKAPEVFQGHTPLEGYASTYSAADFYQEPVFEPFMRE